MKNKYWLIAFSVLCLICAGAWMALPNKSECHVVEIYQNSKLLYTIDLNAVQEPYDIVLGDDEMYNTIHITHDASPIVCLPNRVLIQYQDNKGGDVDAVTGAVS